MDWPLFTLNVASGLSMLLVMYASYMLVKDSRGELARAFKIILIGYIPSAVLHFLNSIAYFGFSFIPEDPALLNIISLTGQITSTLSVFIAIYFMKRALLDKIANFAKKYGEKGGKPRLPGRADANRPKKI